MSAIIPPASKAWDIVSDWSAFTAASLTKDFTVNLSAYDEVMIEFFLTLNNAVGAVPTANCRLQFYTSAVEKFCRGATSRISGTLAQYQYNNTAFHLGDIPSNLTNPDNCGGSGFVHIWKGLDTSRSMIQYLFGGAYAPTGTAPAQNIGGGLLEADISLIDQIRFSVTTDTFRALCRARILARKQN